MAGKSSHWSVAIPSQSLTRSFTTYTCSPATQVQVTEETWPAEEFEVSGDLSAKFDTLSPGASLSHSYTLTPKGKVSTVQRPTIVTYVAEEKGKQLSTSSPWLPFQSFTNQDVLIIKALEAVSGVF